MRVVGGHDQDVVRRQLFLAPCLSTQAAPASSSSRIGAATQFGFLGRGAHVAGMRHGNET